MGVRANLFALNAFILYYVVGHFPCLWNLTASFSVLICVIGVAYVLTKNIYKAVEVIESWSHGKAVLITGCDTGFGHNIAIRLAARGFKVYAGCLSAEGEDAKSLRHHTNITVLKMDVTEQKDVNACFESVKNSLGEARLWAVIANAGVCHNGEFEWQSTKSIHHMFDVNVFGVIRVVQKFLPLLRKAHGRIIITASAAGRITPPGLVPYAMTKHAVVSLADGLRRECIKWGVDVCTIEPVVYRTSISSKEKIEKEFREMLDSLPNEIKKDYGEEYFEDFLNANHNFINLTGRPNTREVGDAMVKAVTDSEPDPYYFCGGLIDNLLYYLNNVIPSEVMDYFVDKILNTNVEVAALKGKP